MWVYRSAGPRQAAPALPPAKAESPPTKCDIFREDLAKLQTMWADSSITLEEIKKVTHWRSLGQISKIARNKLLLPARVRGRKRMAA